MTQMSDDGKILKRNFVLFRTVFSAVKFRFLSFRQGKIRFEHPYCLGAPFVQIFPPVRNDYNVKEGGSLTLICKATGHPRPTIRWTILGGTLFK